MANLESRQDTDPKLEEPSSTPTGFISCIVDAVRLRIFKRSVPVQQKSSVQGWVERNISLAERQRIDRYFKTRLEIQSRGPYVDPQGGGPYGIDRLWGNYRWDRED